MTSISSAISSADIANSAANDARRAAKDNAALIEWLTERIAQLEAAAGIDPTPRPELPSEREQRIMNEQMRAMSNAYTDQDRAYARQFLLGTGHLSGAIVSPGSQRAYSSHGILTVPTLHVNSRKHWWEF